MVGRIEGFVVRCFLVVFDSGFSCFFCYVEVVRVFGSVASLGLVRFTCGVC